MMFRPQLEKTTCATQTSAPNLGIAVKPVNCMHKLDKAAGLFVYSMQLLAQHPWPNQGENGLQVFSEVCKPHPAPSTIRHSPASTGNSMLPRILLFDQAHDIDRSGYLWEC
jgi:hypothetical protein